VANDKHTPTPWHANQRSYDNVLIYGGDGRPVLSLGDDGACGDPECCGSPTYRVDIGADDLALIIKCVNEHEALLRHRDELREALRDAVTIVNGIAKYSECKTAREEAATVRDNLRKALGATP